MGARHLFTSESVTEGHPDKIADQISDAVLDALIAQDPTSRVACEVLVTTGLAMVAGEITSHGYVEIPNLVRKVIAEIGYDSAEYDAIERDIIRHVVLPLMPKRLIDRSKPIKFHINPTGSFVKGGPMADTGLTGRKIIVDTYGGVGSHGGGALSGKDPSKVDRSACYGARYAAKNLVASGLCDRCEVQIAYAIGVPQPVSIMVDSKGTGKVSDEKLTRLVRKHFDLTPDGLIKHLKLRRPIYRATAAYGHFGREEARCTWERTAKARLLARAILAWPEQRRAGS